MSSPSNSDTSATSTSTSTPTAECSSPDHTRLERHLTALIDLTRDVLNPEGVPHRRLISGLLAADKLTRIQDALNRYFTKTQTFNEKDEENCKIVQYHVLAMQTLIRMIESALGLSNSGWKVSSVKVGENHVVLGYGRERPMY
jgi:hypothetical protein